MTSINKFFLGMLIIFLPASIITHLLHLSAPIVFITTCLGIIPLAAFMGRATEEIANKKGPAIGGLLNATFGNATELIIAVIALKAGLYEVVKASITGSIIGNLLLVLGLSLLAGGLKFKSQTFNKAAVTNSSTMLIIAVIGLIVPAGFVYATSYTAESAVVQKLSFLVAVILLFVYLLGLIFSLHTHHHLFRSKEEDHENSLPHNNLEKPWSNKFSVFILFLTTVLVIVESEILVHSIEATAKLLGFTQLFIGVVIVAIIGNAAEHGVAVVMAMKGKIDLAITVATGSSTQIALFVAPFLVILGSFICCPMSLVFIPFEILAITIAVIISTMVSLDGESNWYEGVLLLAVYLILAAAFFYIR